MSAMPGMPGMSAMPGMTPMTPMTPMAPMPTMYPTGYGTTPNNTVGGGSRLVYTRTDISMEEWKALQPQYRYQEWLTAINSTM